jgi:hypothetical protein
LGKVNNPMFEKVGLHVSRLLNHDRDEEPVRKPTLAYAAGWDMKSFRIGSKSGEAFRSIRLTTSDFRNLT